MIVMFLIFSVVLTPVLMFVASLIGSAAGFTLALAFHAVRAVMKAAIRRVFQEAPCGLS